MDLKGITRDALLERYSALEKKEPSKGLLLELKKLYNMHTRGEINSESISKRYKQYIETIIDSINFQNLERCLAKISPPITGDPRDLFVVKYPLKKHQEEALEFMAKREETEIYGISGGILNMAMGLGKTYIILTRIMLTRHVSSFPTLVIVDPILITTWTIDGVKKFFPQLKYKVFTTEDYSKDDDNYMQEDLLMYDLVITTYDFLSAIIEASAKKEKTKKDALWKRNCEYVSKRVNGKTKNVLVAKKVVERPIMEGNVSLSDFSPKFGREILFYFPWHRIVCDESQKIKNSSTIIFATLMSLYTTHAWCMSGTVMVNSSDDVFSQLRFCGLEGIDTVGRWNDAEYKRLGLDRVVFTKGASLLSLPPLRSVYDICRFSSEEKVFYVKYLQEFFTAVEEARYKQNSAGTVLAKITQLRQICVCPLILIKEPTREEKNGYLGKYCTKFRKVYKILKEIPKGEKCLIFSFFQDYFPFFQNCIESETGKKSVIICGSVKVDERIRSLEEFKTSPNTNVAIISYSTGGRGLNLPQANHVIFMEPFWNNAMLRQAAGRAYRTGQTRPVTVHNLFVDGSIDMPIIKLTRIKNKNITDLIADDSIEESEMDTGDGTVALHIIQDIIKGLLKINILHKVKVASEDDISVEESAIAEDEIDKIFAADSSGSSKESSSKEGSSSSKKSSSKK